MRWRGFKSKKPYRPHVTMLAIKGENGRYVVTLRMTGRGLKAIREATVISEI